MFTKLDCPILVDRTYASFALIVVILLSYALVIICSHSLLLHSTDAYISRGVLSWIFLKNVQNDIFGQKLNSIQYAHT
jgi:hypothetical protein